MNIQPYFPDPITVQDNAADQNYDVRLNFIRRVSAIHFFSVALVCGVAVFVPAKWSLAPTGLCLLSALLALSLVRQLFDGGKGGVIVSTAVLVPVVLFSGWFARLMYDNGVPVESIAVMFLMANTYSLLCGRDFSFVGQFFLSGAFLVLIFIAVGIIEGRSAMTILFGIGLGLGALLYYVYDLAALLTRRRIGEELSAVADLYRDTLNFLSYSVRVVKHWRQFRI